jgi:hypothetical protein
VAPRSATHTDEDHNRPRDAAGGHAVLAGTATSRTTTRA